MTATRGDGSLLADAGWVNLRDLGGLTTADGRSVRPGLLFRAENPELTEVAERTSVASLGLRSVVDLRSRREVDHACVDWATYDVAYTRVPLSAGASDSWHARYTSYLDQRPANVVAAVRAFITPERHPVLVHCAAGKDRTGVVVALALAVLGVPADQIAADYVLSAPAVESILRRLEASGLFEVSTSPEFVADQTPRAETIIGLLDWLADQGGAETWLTTHGIRAEELEACRTSVLDAG